MSGSDMIPGEIFATAGEIVLNRQSLEQLKGYLWRKK